MAALDLRRGHFFAGPEVVCRRMYDGGMHWRRPEPWRWFASTMWLGIAVGLIWFAYVSSSYVYLLLSFPCLGAACGTPFHQGTFGALIATVGCFALALIYLSFAGALPRL